MKNKLITNLSVPSDCKLTKQQMNVLKGGDDDILLNNGTGVSDINFGG